MGGYGSGRWYGRERRQVVEHCVFFSSDDLPVTLSQHHLFMLPLRRHGGEWVTTLCCEYVILRTGQPVVRFRLRPGCADDDDSIPRTLPLGWSGAGSRVCFLCPVAQGDGFCGRPCRKLYVPPGSLLPGCRRCHRLSYSSSQRRKQRLARSEAEADRLLSLDDELFARAQRGEASFREQMRYMRVLSYVISDIWESLRQTEDT